MQKAIRILLTSPRPALTWQIWEMIWLPSNRAHLNQQGHGVDGAGCASCVWLDHQLKQARIGRLRWPNAESMPRSQVLPSTYSTCPCMWIRDWNLYPHTALVLYNMACGVHEMFGCTTGENQAQILKLRWKMSADIRPPSLSLPSRCPHHANVDLVGELPSTALAAIPNCTPHGAISR